ncbi:MAG: 4-hydroxythreonine-4-phosphate dehydrogenase PdxA [Nitrospinota bacterium]|nr:4-hydroxythreonine-4-phosphate dehydrogenase PdxA [Nitrospinota bacterium]
MKRRRHFPDKPIAITWGDPAGIGPEVIIKAFATLPAALQKRILVFGDPEHLARLAEGLGAPIRIIEAEQSSGGGGVLAVRRAAIFTYNPASMGKVSKNAGKAAMSAVEMAAHMALDGGVSALVTAPISKEAANRAGYKIAGHTEFLAHVAGSIPVAMMLASKKLKVVVATTHLAIKDVPSALDSGKLTELILLVANSVKQYGLASPKIAVSGLNPHASDGGLFGQEEAAIIAPAIRAARHAGVEVSGPYPADTMFTPAARARYDLAIAMYHDQGLIPVKALSFGETVNVTLGLPFLRVSVDHGTAFDIAGKNQANWRPMAYAIRTAARMLRGGF